MPKGACASCSGFLHRCRDIQNRSLTQLAGSICAVHYPNQRLADYAFGVEFMSRIVKFALAFILAVGGAALAPAHACRLSSTPLLISVAIVCFILLPVVACRASRPKVAWAITLAAPVVTFGAMLFYLDVLHWEQFPSWLLDKEDVSSVRQCQSNLKQIGGAKTMWAEEHHKTTNDTPTWVDLVGADRYLNGQPTCNGGGTYTIGRFGERARCSIEGHSL